MIESIIKENLPEFNIPVRYIFRDKLPLTTINKIDFRTLEEESLIDSEVMTYHDKNIKVLKK